MPTLDRLRRSELGDAAGLLARAFADSPNFVELYADPEVRMRALPPLFGAAVRDALAAGEVHCARIDGKLAGVATWLPPGRWRMSPRRQLRVTGDVARLVLASPAAARRMVALQREIEALHPAEPHWYLAIVGIEPKRQGTGVGRELLAPPLLRADREGVACYLETPTRVNVRFYESLGFEVTRETPLLPGGPVNWTMLRPARPARAPRAGVPGRPA